ncbi:MAR-binding filament-like protein [Quillaja saponaria]|uniref:MAR-binding filament-like protein n=1 Tax=Quillaja saponaria TaxID=32244 RepID=A0AAD7M080_QUISA|nr:MAR-binding filament-like protein [Quillaja saponaria]
MATLPSFLSSSLLLPSLTRLRPSLSFSISPLWCNPNPRRIRTPLIFASSAPSFDDFTSKSWYRPVDSSKFSCTNGVLWWEMNSKLIRRISSNKSVLAKLIQEIEPLDVSHFQKDVSQTTIDAMKWTISGMLGLLPSDQFQVLIEALWEPLSKLLVSSMMTGYTLRNAEYRLCLERNLDMYDGNLERRQNPESTKLDLQGMLLDSTNMINFCRKNDLSSKIENFNEVKSENFDIQDLCEIFPEAQQYIHHLQSRLSSVKKELHDVKRKNAALQMQQFVGEEKNDLLDYLRSLQPEKVAELSEPTSPEVKETIHSVVHGLLATLSPKMQSKAPNLSDNTTAGTVNVGGEDCAELVENTSPQFQPFVSLTRDYVARLLFWCMLLGHYLRGLEYRMELIELLSLTIGIENDGTNGEQIS